MKTCALCGETAEASTETCAACGEGTFVESSVDVSASQRPTPEVEEPPVSKKSKQRR